MKITFGIITSQIYARYIPNTSLSVIFDSIANEQINDDIEILVVGGDKSWTQEEYRFVAFDETQKSKWITRKKNIITAEAKYDNVVYMHDYVTLMSGWYKGMKKFEDNFDICMTKIHNADGTRFRDWTLWGDDLVEAKVFSNKHGKYLLPYDVTHFTRHMYISGAYWIAKKSVMERFPLDESLSWGESEDVKWSKQVREHYKFSINPLSSVKLLKQKERIFNEATPEVIKQVEDYNATL